MKKITILVFILLSTGMFGQEQLSLDACYDMVNSNYPLAKKTDLLAKQNEIDLEIIKTESLPKIDFLIQTSYQSDVTKMPIVIPGYEIESPNLDQYKSTLSVNQLIYAGGAIDATTNVKLAELKTQQKQIEVSLYQLKNQVNQLYFSILNLQEKKALLKAKQKQLLAQLKEVKSGIKNGVVLPSSDTVLEVELVKIEQQFVEIEMNKLSLIETLSKLIGKEIDTNIVLENPIVSTNFSSEINRPELDLFRLQKEQLDTSEILLSKQNAPKIMGFATGGYGNPGLDMLDNAFTAYYLVGVKLNWNVFDGSKTKKQRKSLLMNKEIIDNETEVFNLNTSIELNQQQSEIDKVNAFIESDNSIVKLRKVILKTAESQLKNGVITSSAYITELTNLYEAENNLSTHKIQLLLAKANYNITQGN